MLYDLLTGILSLCFIALCLLYPFRLNFKILNKGNKIKFHCISGFVALLITFIHVNYKLGNPNLSQGFIAFIMLLLLTITGFMKRRYMKNRYFYIFHIVLVIIFIFTLIIHITQKILNLLFM
jgi:hypothetical protein